MKSLSLLAALSLSAVSAAAQEPARPVTGTPLPVGADAPDFTLAAATKDGVLPSPLKLSDLRDKTVVIAFFFRARTSG
jgi:hypothetical protein